MTHYAAAVDDVADLREIRVGDKTTLGGGHAGDRRISGLRGEGRKPRYEDK